MTSNLRKMDHYHKVMAQAAGQELALSSIMMIMSMTMIGCRTQGDTSKVKTSDSTYSRDGAVNRREADAAGTLPSVTDLKAKYPLAFDSPCVSPYSDGLFHPTAALLDFRKQPFGNENIFGFEALAKSVEVQLRRIPASARAKVRSLQDLCDKDQLDAAGFEDSLPYNRLEDLEKTQQALLDGLNDGMVPQTAKDELSAALKEFPNFRWFSGNLTFDDDSFKIGSVVKVRGQGLTGATSVMFGKVPAASFQVVSDTYLTAVIPKGMIHGRVAVITPKGKLTSGDAVWIDASSAP